MVKEMKKRFKWHREHGFLEKDKPRRFKKKKNGPAKTRDREAVNRAFILRDRATRTELAFKDFLDKNAVLYVFQNIQFYGNGQYRIVDFHLIEYKLNIELDGNHHYSDPEELKYDQLKDSQSKYPTMRIKNHEVFQEGFGNKFLAMLAARK